MRALARVEGVEVVVAREPETFSALEDADVVVDVSSSHAVAPDALARFCLERGLTMLEASSDRVVIERLLDAGIFTGISNAMAGEVARALPDADAIEIGVSSSPFSGAGGGTIDLMADVLSIPTGTIRAGVRVDDRPVEAGPELPFPGGRRPTLHVPFAEPVMVHGGWRRDRGDRARARPSSRRGHEREGHAPRGRGRALHPG